MRNGLKLDLKETSRLPQSTPIEKERQKLATDLDHLLDARFWHTYMAEDLFCVSWKGKDNAAPRPGGRQNHSVRKLVIPRHCYGVRLDVNAGGDLELDVANDSLVKFDATDAEASELFFVSDDPDSGHGSPIDASHNCEKLDLADAQKQGGAFHRVELPRIGDTTGANTIFVPKLYFFHGVAGGACPAIRSYSGGLMAMQWDWEKTYHNGSGTDKDALLHNFLALKFLGQRSVLLIAGEISGGNIMWIPILNGKELKLLKEAIVNPNSRAYYKSRDVTYLDGPDIFIGRLEI